MAQKQLFANEEVESVSSRRELVAKEFKGVRGSYLYCPWCVNYYGGQLHRHMTKSCKECPVPGERRNEEAAACINKLRQSMAKYPANMFFNPYQIEDRMYTKAELCHTLEVWGHSAVPQHMQQKVEIRPLSLDHVQYQYREAASQVNFSLDAYIPPLVRLPTVSAETAMSAHTATNSTPAIGGFIPDPDNSTMDTEDSSREMGIGGWVGKEKETFSDTGSARRRLVITEEDEEDAAARPLEDILDYSTEEVEQEDTIRKTPMDNSTDTEDESTKPVSRNSKRIILSSPEDVTPRKKSGPKKSPYGYKRTLTRSPGLRTPKKNLMNTYDYTDGTKGRLSSAGFYAVPIGFEKQEVFLKLGKWYAMQGKCNKEQSVKNVVRLTYLMGNKASRFNIRNITAERYILANEFLRSHNVDVQTLINYNKCMKHFFDFYLNDDCINLKRDDRGEYDRVKAIKYKFGLIFKQLEKEARDRQRQKKATELSPATPYEVQTVLRVAKPTFEKSMEACKQRVLSKVELAEVNRYIAAFVCLAQGNRPSVVTNLTAAEYHTATSQAPIVKQGQKYWVVMVEKHKTALQYDANIVLDDYWKEKLQSYNKYIRQQRVQAKNTENDNFILQHDGQPFVKVSHGLTQLHRKYKLHPEYTANDARKSFETYSSRLNKELRKDISNYLAHSEHVAKTHYRAQGQHKAVETTIQLKGMYQYYTTHDRDDHPQAYELTEGSAIEGEGEVEQQEPQEGTSTGGETSQGDETAETNANNIATPPRQPPMAPKTGKTTIIKKTHEIMMELMAQFNDDLTQAQIPSTTSIMDQFNVRSVDQAKQINRKLRYKKEEAWTEYFANKQLVRTSKQKRIHVAQLNEVPQPPTSEDMYEKCSIKINQSKVQKRMTEILRQHKTDFKQRSEEGLMTFIQKQNWKHICIGDATEEKGKGVFATDDMIKAGDVVCDYHGAIRTAQEAERRLKDLPPPICNYMLFFKSKHGTKMCVDASTECECHPPGVYLNTSPGRFVNHSAKKPNLKPMRREVNDKEVVLLVATRDIKAEEELLFDYGSRRSEDGEKLDWLHA